MKVISLNGKWNCCPDLNDVGIQDKWHDPSKFDELQDQLEEIEIPSSFNLIKKYSLYEGIFWHFYEFKISKVDINEKIDYRLIFKGCNYLTLVWLNGFFLGYHEGGFTPFSFDIERKSLKEKNFLVVRTDNARRKGQIPDLAFDWFNWGGIYRDVELQLLDKNRVKNVQIKTRLIALNEWNIDISFVIKGHLSINWKILDGANGNIIKEGVERNLEKKGNISVILKGLKTWSPEEPNLYYLKIVSIEKDKENAILFNHHFGIRQIEVVGNRILLNKKPIMLKGVSLHEELIQYGRTIPIKKREQDLIDIKSLGFNTVRTAHYSHDESLLNLADKIGILILEEIPIWGKFDYKNPRTFILACKMIKEMIYRDFNHPSVIWWSVGNEIPIENPLVSKFIKNLMDWARKLDDTRIVTYVSYRIFSDVYRHHADVATINFYFGWYFANVKQINLFLNIMRVTAQNKPWIFTEFGAGAKFGFHQKLKKFIKYSEERQLLTLEYSIRTFNAMEHLSGWLIWNYRDFRSLSRQNEFQMGFNRKGIVSEKTFEKKLIYHRLPKIIEAKRKIMNTRFLGLLIWLILFPIAWILTLTIYAPLLNLFERNVIEKGKLKEMKRLNLNQ